VKPSQNVSGASPSLTSSPSDLRNLTSSHIRTSLCPQPTGAVPPGEGAGFNVLAGAHVLMSRPGVVRRWRGRCPSGAHTGGRPVPGGAHDGGGRGVGPWPGAGAARGARGGPR
jgi:hypothetical protein